MKVFVLLGLVALAFASRQQWHDELQRREISETHFRGQREYRYLYNGQVATGLPQTSNQHSATRVQSLVTLRIEDEDTALLKLDEIRFATLNKEIVREMREIQKFEAFEEQTLEKEQLETLRLPLRFQYVNGIVSEIEFHREDQPWSKNIKRAVLNMLQINIKGDSRTDNEELRRLQLSDDKKDSKFDFFNVQERTLEGDCEVAYTITRMPTSTEEVMNITKSINFEKCRERTDIRYNFGYGAPETTEPRLEKNEKSLDSTTVISFNVTGNPSRFMIEEVEVKSQYMMAPLNKEENLIATYVCAKLQLIETSEKKSVQEPTSTVEKESLMYSVEWELMKERFEMDGDEEFLRHIPRSEMKNKVELVEQIIARLVRSSSDSKYGMEIDVTRQLARLVKVLSLMSREEIRKIHKEVCESSKYDEKVTEKVRDIFNDALAIAGTKNTMEHVIEKIVTRKISPMKAAMVMKSFMSTRAVSEKHLDMIREMCEHNVVEEHPVLKQSCWLTLGSMVGKMCKESDDKLAIEIQSKKVEKRCPRSLKEKYLRTFVELFKNAENKYEKVLALKTLANAGLDLSVFELEKIIVDKKEDVVIRGQAIDALRQLTEEMPRKIQRILMPVFKNRFEVPELRMNSFIQILNTQPERSILDQISHQLFVEKNHQVHAFVYNTMKSFANSTSPMEKRMAEDLQVSLRLARNQPEQWLDSRYVHLPLYSEEHKAGLTIDLASIFTKDSYLPKELMASLDVLIGGQWNKNGAQFGFVQQNFDKVIEKFLKSIEDKKIEEFVVRGKRSSSFRPQEMLRNMFSKLSITSRRDGKQTPYSMLYLRYKNLDYAIVPFDQETLPELVKNVIKEGKLDISSLERFLSQGSSFSTHMATFNYDAERKIPTTLGFPLKVNGKNPTLFGIKGHFKVELEPKNSNKVHGFKLYLVAQPTVATSHVVKVEIWSPIASSGIKIVQSAQLNLPIDTVIEAKVEDKLTIKYTIRAPETEKRIISLQTRPASFIRQWPKNAKTYAEPEEKTILGEELEDKLVNVERVYGEKLLGCSIRVNGQYHKINSQRVRGTPSSLLAGHNFMEVIVGPGHETPREFIVKIEAENVESESKLEKPTLERFYSEQSVEERERFETEDEDNEDERRQHFERYAKNFKSEKGYKHRIVVSMEAVGSSVERKANLIVKSVCDETLRHCKVQLDARRTPMPEYESREWTFTSEIETLYPEIAYSLKQLKDQKHREFNAKLNMKWGSEDKQEIKIKVQGEQTKEQQRWIERISHEERRTPIDEYELMVSIAQLNQYKIAGEYKLNKMSQNITNKVFNLLKSWNVINRDVSLLTEKEIKENRFYGKLTIDPRTRQTVNFTVETPVERVQWFDIVLPFRVTPLNIRREFSPMKTVGQIVRKMSTSGSECRVRSRSINTFDDVEFKAPLTNCYSVLAKDCSSEEPKFVVLMKKVEKTSEEKKMKIITEDKIVELEVEEDKVIVKIDGKIVKNDEKLEEEHRIIRQGKIVKVEMENEGVYVHFDGYTARIQVSNMYKNGQCGLCGHFDGESDDEFRMADNKLTENLESYHRSYLNEDEECEKDESELSESKNYKFLGQRDSSEEEEEEKKRIFDSSEEDEEEKRSRNVEDDESTEEKEPKKMTKVIEYNHEICFSVKPLEECPQGTESTETVEKKVQFACLSRNTSEARRLLREARNRIVDVKSEKVSFVETVKVPVKCSKY